MFKSILKKFLSFLLHGKQRPVYAKIVCLDSSKKLEGKKVVVTGGGRGLGASMAEKFVKEGASVLIAGRNESVLKATADKIGCQYLTLDVSDVSSFDSFIEKSEELLGGITSLVNNAGISLHEKTFFDVTPETFDSQINTNMKGSFFLTQKVIRLWKEKNLKGDVLFISSETGDMMDFRPYGFTKVAVNSMVQGLAYLFAKDQIRINAVAPGVTISDMTGQRIDGNLYHKKNMLGRVYLPDEVAETACFLLSDAAGCISGQIITCNNAKSVNARWK
jgi:3-oxoacyl-[acyl-carrier protein] reductase